MNQSHEIAGFAVMSAELSGGHLKTSNLLRGILSTNNSDSEPNRVASQATASL